MSGIVEPEALPPACRRVVEAGARAGVEVLVRRFDEGTRTARDAAAAIGCDLGAIVKSLVLRSADGALVVLTSGHNRVDYRKVAALAGVAAVERADAALARDATGYAIGGTPPFGHRQDLPVLLDEDLLGYAEVWAAAGTPDTVFALTPVQLRDATGARPGDVAER